MISTSHFAREVATDGMNISQRDRKRNHCIVGDLGKRMTTFIVMCQAKAKANSQGMNSLHLSHKEKMPRCAQLDWIFFSRKCDMVEQSKKEKMESHTLNKNTQKKGRF